jgi:putative ABC transport system ATP-binding protein
MDVGQDQSGGDSDARVIDSLAIDSLAVRCRGVVKEFGSGQTRIRVLRGVDFDVKLGETTFLVGPSGCGKTTLISVIAGLLRANAGEIEVFGKNIGKMRGGMLVRFRSNNLGFIFQQFNLLPALNAVENAAVPLVVQGMSLRKAVRKASELLEQLGMGKHKHKYPNQLSGGQQQRIAIARAVVHQPKLVICDEPTASLDAQTGHSVMELLKTLASAPDRAVVVVTHDSRILSFADCIATMSDGQIISVQTKLALNAIEENS